MPSTYESPIATSWTDLPSYEDYKNKPREPKNDLGRTDFLRLLAAQLQYQDPLQPMTDSAFVAQLAQFSALQQMENLNSTMTQYQYYNLSGKYIYAEVTLNGQPTIVTGIVDRVIHKDGTTYVDVGGLTFEARLVSEVWDRDLYADGTTLINNTGLIGKIVTGFEVVQDEEGNNIRRDVTGRIVSLAVDNGAMLANVQEASGRITPIYVGSISSISEDTTAQKAETVPENNVNPGGAAPTEEDDTLPVDPVDEEPGIDPPEEVTEPDDAA